MASSPAEPPPAENVLELAVSGEDLHQLMKAVLARGGVFHFRARGWSMTPFIRNGDTITVAPVSMEAPAVGKVVACLQPATGQLVVHRIIARQGAAYLVQGDNAAGQPDDLVAPQDILGCVTRVERDGRRVYLGLGPERRLVAYLSRSKRLGGLLRRLRLLRSALTLTA
jgi:hypothetical protein